MNNQIRYTRNSKGDFVRTTVDVTKKVVEAAVDVVAGYADLLLGALNLAIRIGLFIALLPYISKFVKMFVEVATQVGGPLSGN